MAAGTFRCAQHLARLAVARGNARDIGVRVFDVIHDMLAGDRRPTPVDRNHLPALRFRATRRDASRRLPIIL